MAVPYSNGSHLPTNSSHLGDLRDSESEHGGGGGGSRSGMWRSSSAVFSSGGGGGGSVSGGNGGSGRVGGGWRAALHKLFSRGHDVEAAGVNHTYTAEERAQLKQFQSIDYLAPSSRVYRQWLAAQPWGRYWDRWLMMALSGMAVGLVGFFLHFVIHILSATKYHVTRSAPLLLLLQHAARAAARAAAPVLQMLLLDLMRRLASSPLPDAVNLLLLSAAAAVVTPASVENCLCTCSLVLLCCCLMPTPACCHLDVSSPLQLAAGAHARCDWLDVQHQLLPGPRVRLHLAGHKRGPRGGRGGGG